MSNKKYYNNLFESISCILLLIVLVVFYTVTIYFGVINSGTTSKPINTFVISTIVFGTMILAIIFLIVKGCFSYWYVKEEKIFSKKIFNKVQMIHIEEIKHIERKVVPYLIFGIYKSDAYIIKDTEEKIMVLINKKNVDILERLFQHKV